MTRRPQTILVNLALGLSLAWVAGALPLAAGAPVSGECITATIDEPIRLPSGEEHVPGRLTLCVTRHFTPVTTLHKTYVDGRLIGLLQSRRGYSEGGSDRPYMMFHRDGQGRLNLYGFATPAGSRMATYNLGPATGASFGSSTMARGAAAGAGTLVLMANSGPVGAR